MIIELCLFCAEEEEKLQRRSHRELEEKPPKEEDMVGKILKFFGVAEP